MNLSVDEKFKNQFYFFLFHLTVLDLFGESKKFDIM